MKRPPFDVIVGALIVIGSAFRPILELTTDQVTLLDTPPDYFLIGAAVVALLSAVYPGQTRGCLGLSVTIAIIPIASKFMTAANIQEKFGLVGVTQYSSASFGVWVGALCIFVAASKQLLKEAKAGTLNEDES